MFHLTIFIALYGYLFIHRPKLRPVELVGIIAATAIWLNIHSAGLIFPALVVLYVSVEYLQQLTGWRRPKPSDLGEGNKARLAALAIGVVGATIMTPHHFLLVPYALESFEVNIKSAEWLPITSYWDRRNFMPYAIETFWILLGLTWLLALTRIRRISLSQLAVVLALSIMPLMAQRHVSTYFAPILFCFGQLACVVREMPSGRSSTAVRGTIGVAAVTAVLVMATQVMTLPRSIDSIGRRMSSTHIFSNHVFPVGAVDFLNRVQLRSRLYHPARWGGYIVWETQGRYPTFADGRWVTIGKQIMNDSDRIEVRAASTFSKLEEYGIDLLLVPRGWMKEDVRLERDWLTIFENVNAGVYLRNTPRTRDDLVRVREYYAFENVPFNSLLGFDEHIAYQGNRSWARRFRVVRTHFEQFRMSEMSVVHRGGNRVNGW